MCTRTKCELLRLHTPFRISIDRFVLDEIFELWNDKIFDWYHTMHYKKNGICRAKRNFAMGSLALSASYLWPPCWLVRRLVFDPVDLLLQSSAIQYDMILYTSLHFPRHNISQSVNPQKTRHTSPVRARFGVSLVRIFKKIDRVITALHCISRDVLYPRVTLCKLKERLAIAISPRAGLHVRYNTNIS